MRKKTLFIALLLVLVLALSGCNLIVKDQNVDNALIILSYKDNNVTKSEVLNLAYEQMYQEAQMYMNYGMNYDFSDPAKLKAAEEYVIENYFKPNLVTQEKVKEFGLDQLSQEEQDEIQAKAKETFESQKEFITTFEFSDTQLEGEALEQAINDRMTEYGYDFDLFVESEKNTLVGEKLKAKVIEGISVSDEEVEEAYDLKVQTDKENYTANPSSFASAVNNGTKVYYTPAGARHIKHILRSYPEDVKSEITALNSSVAAAEAEITTINSNITALNANEEATQEEKDTLTVQLREKEEELSQLQKDLEDKIANAAAALDEDVQKVLAKLEEGKSFDEVMAEDGEDPGMKQEPAMSTGYAVVENFTSFDPAFVKGAMALTKIGDISMPVPGLNGVHILEYTSDITEGETAFDDVKQSIYDELLTQKQNEYYQAEVDAWVAAAEFTVNMKNLSR